MKREESYFEKGKCLGKFSLLYPPEVPSEGHAAMELNPAAAHDLGLDEIIAAFAPERGHQKEIRDLFSRLPRDPGVIAYRQAVLEDLLANPELTERLTALFPVIDSLFEYSSHLHREMTWLHEVAWRAGELQNIIDCFEGMGEILRSVEGRLHSDGLRSLREEIRKAQSDPQRNVEGPYAFPINSDLGWAIDPLMVPLFADLANVLEKTAIPIADRLSQYAGLHGKLFTDLRQALLFYLGAIRFIRRFEKLGLSMCRPQIAPAEERRCEVKDSYNVHLVLKHLELENGTGPAIVENDVFLGPRGHILILTGPNRGGKTTYMQGAGVLHILAQLGLRVPGQQAVISPLDHLFTHFPLEEKPESDAGRFGEEAMRLGKIFEQVTRYSLVLLNESLSSTSFSESLYLAQDLVRILRRIGARAIYSTHLHELASRVDELNDSVPGDSKIVSVVSSPIDTDGRANGADANRTYKLETRPPLGQSYAREIAARYGISYEQLENVLSERGVL